MKRNRRSTYACARCYKRKKKCDNAHPSCSACARSGSQCVGIDRESKAEIPRSLVTFLEEVVAQLELRISSTGKSGYVRENRDTHAANLEIRATDTAISGFDLGGSGHPINPGSQPAHRQLSHTFTYSSAVSISQSSVPFTIVNQPLVTKLPYCKAFFRGAELPYPLAFEAQRPISLPTPDSGVNFNGIPVELTDKLYVVYTERILPQYPFFSRQYIFDIYERFRRGKGESSSLLLAHETFIMSMVLAITTLSSKSKDYSKSVALAESLRSNAIRTLDADFSLSRPSVVSIQCLLLLAHYGLLLPSSANLWHIVGDAMRIAIELGLHQEVPPFSELDEVEIESRRLLFWALYSMERSVAVTSHRPYAIRDEQVDLSLPLARGDHSLSSPRPGQFPYIRFIDRLQFHMLQSEICAINIGKRAIPSGRLSYGEWLVDMERRINETKAIASPETAMEPSICDLMAWHSMLLLHMPCARNPEPGESSILKCFDAAVRLSEGYWELAQSASVEFPWYAVHNAYEAGMLILYLISYFPGLIRSRHHQKRVFEVVHQLSGFFILITKRWPGIRLCGSLFDGLRKGALASFVEEDPAFEGTNMEMKRLKDIVFRENADFLYTYEESLPDVRTSYADNAADFEGLIPSQIFSDDMDFQYLFDFSPLNVDFGQEDFDQTGTNNLPELGETSTTAVVAQQFFTGDDHPGPPIDRQQLKAAMDQLPPCSYCRRRKIKCDMMLPSCRNCTKFQKECSYWDATLSQETSRSHVQALLQQVESLLLKLEKYQQALGSGLGGAPLDTAYDNFPAQDLGSNGTNTHPSRINVLCILDGAADGAPSTLFFGPTSAFARLLLQNLAVAPVLQETTFSLRGIEDMVTSFVQSIPGSAPSLPPREVADALTRYYSQSIEICYPILGPHLIQQILETVYTGDTDNEDGESTRMKLDLVVAISFALLSKHDQKLYFVADAFFSKAMSRVALTDDFTSPTISSLQIILLSCVYVWICPVANNIWRFLGHACRVCLDVVETHDSEKTESSRIGVLYRTLYSLESHVAMVFGRPRQLPDGKEPSVTSPGETSSTADDTAMLVYDLARLQSRFQREMIGQRQISFTNPSGFRSENESWMETSLREIICWLDLWDSKVESWRGSATASDDSEHLYQALLLWGRFQQAEALLLAETVSERKVKVLLSSEERLIIAKRLLKAACQLHKRTFGSGSGSPGGNPAFTFPMAWTHLHTMFNAGVSLLLQPRASLEADTEVDEIIRSCLSILASVESAIQPASTGLADCLQGIYRAYTSQTLG